jgi:putative hemolysin
MPIFESARAMLERAPVFMQHYLLPDELERAWTEAARGAKGAAIFARFLDCMQVRYACADEDLRRVPGKGPVVMVANHPFGLVEGAILAALVARSRGDVKILANSMLSGIPALDEHLIPVDPFGAAAKTNWRGVRASLEWLDRGGALITFPAGEVASLHFPDMQIADPAWNENVARLIRMSGARSVPAYFHGANGPAFQIAGLIHPRLRTALLPRELLNKRGRTIRVAIGTPIRAERVAELDQAREATGYLRQRTHLLEARGAVAAPRWKFEPRRAPLAGAADPAVMQAEFERIEPLAESGDLAVGIARATQIPDTLREIGRLRELSFRNAGEGTGRSLDLDRFDRHYLHLWIWNRKAREVVGAYRLAGTDEVDSPRDLYTSTLFKFHPELLGRFFPALELGRSFVRPEYQKSYGALLLLWKGIGHYVARHPRYRYLFGPVSISREYCSASRALMVEFLRSHCGNTQLEGLVKPRRQFRAHGVRGFDARLMGSLLSNLDELSEVVDDLEADGKGVPVLLRQYLNAGGQMLSFNVDAQFSDVLDGLVMVDLTRMSGSLLDRYLGKSGAQTFRERWEMAGAEDGNRA